MKFCMITTFFGAHSFGGDAAYVDRLSQALCRRGHEVHVYYCVDAFNAVRGDHPLRRVHAAAGLAPASPRRVQFGILSPLATQATGRPWFKADALREVLDDRRDRRRALPQHLTGRRAGRTRPGCEPPGRADHDGARALADLPDAPALEVRPADLRRAELHPLQPGGRSAAPGLAMDRGHRTRAATPRRAGLPQPSRAGRASPPRTGRVRTDGPPALLPPRRLVAGNRGRGARAARSALPRGRGAAGQDEGISAVDPDDARTSPRPTCGSPGAGPYEADLRALARDLPNVHFEGLLGGAALARLFRGARAVVVPSLFPETFGYVVLEAFAVRTPVVVHEEAAPCWKRACRAAAGSVTATDIELLTALRRILHDPELTRRAGQPRVRQADGRMVRDRHLDRYLDLVDQGRTIAARPVALSSRPGTRAAGGPTATADRCDSRLIDQTLKKEPTPVMRGASSIDRTADPRRPAAGPGRILLREADRRAWGTDRRWPSAQRRLCEPGRSTARRQRPGLLVPPASLVDRPAARPVRPLAGVGRARVRWASADRQPAGRDVLSTGLGGMVAASPGRARLADGRPSALGRTGCVRAGPGHGPGPVGGDGRGRGLSGISSVTGPHLRGALSPRLGGLLVSLGVLGVPRLPQWPGSGSAAVAPDPGPRLI